MRYKKALLIVAVLGLVIAFGSGLQSGLLSRAVGIDIRDNHLRHAQQDIDFFDLIYRGRGKYEFRTNVSTVKANVAIYRGAELVAHRVISNLSGGFGNEDTPPQRDGTLLWGMRAEHAALGEIDLLLQVGGAWTQTSVDIKELVDDILEFGVSKPMIMHYPMYITRDERIPLHIWATNHITHEGIDEYGNPYIVRSGGSVASNWLSAFDEDMLSNNAQTVILYMIFTDDDDIHIQR